MALSFTALYPFLQDLNAPTLLCGASTCLCCLASSIVFYLSKKVIGAFHGTFNVMCVSCFFWSVRCFSISFLENPYYVLVTDLLHGITYSVFLITSMEHVKDISHPSIVSTMSGIVNALYNYFSFAIASIVGGTVYQVYGGRKLFIAMSMACLLWSLVMICYIVVRNKRNGKESSKKILCDYT